jgi:hypothetical protein
VSFFSLLLNEIIIAFEQPQELCCSQGKQSKKKVASPSAWAAALGEEGF